MGGAKRARWIRANPLSKLKPRAQIDLAHLLVFNQLLRGPFRKYFSLSQNVGTVGDMESFPDIVIGEKDCDTFAF